MKLITDILRDARRGEIVTMASERFAEVVKKVDETNQAGSMTITIKVIPDKHGGWQKNLSFDVKTKLPAPPLPDATFFSTPDGDLVRDDPEQGKLFEDADTQRTKRHS